MNSNNKNLIIVTGMQASGKTTLCKGLETALEGDVIYYPKDDLDLVLCVAAGFEHPVKLGDPSYEKFVYPATYGLLDFIGRAEFRGAHLTRSETLDSLRQIFSRQLEDSNKQEYLEFMNIVGPALASYIAYRHQSVSTVNNVIIEGPFALFMQSPEKAAELARKWDGIVDGTGGKWTHFRCFAPHEIVSGRLKNRGLARDMHQLTVLDHTYATQPRNVPDILKPVYIDTTEPAAKILSEALRHLNHA